MKFLVIYIIALLGSIFLAGFICDLFQTIAQRNAEISAYRNYYRSVERVLYHAHTDSVSPVVYNRYLDAVSALDKYREDEP